MGFFTECVLSTIELNPIRCNIKVYRSHETIFYRWQFDEKTEQNRMEDESQVFKSLGEGTLLVKHKFIEPNESYAVSCVKEIRSGLIKSKKGFEFKYSYSPRKESEAVLYHVVLPEFCYCDENSIERNENVHVKSLGINKRQSITWVMFKPFRNLVQKFIFYGPNETEFKKRQQKIPRKIIVSPEMKLIYKEVKDLAPIAISAVK